jgi:hypothetical protein
LESGVFIGSPGSVLGDQPLARLSGEGLRLFYFFASFVHNVFSKRRSGRCAYLKRSANF